MNRREAIERAGLILGYAITGPALTGVLQGCTAVPKENFEPQFLCMEQARLVAALTEIILPRTDTPGAIDAGVPMFIDRMLKEVYPKESQEAFIKNLTAFDEGAKKSLGQSFLDGDDAKKLAYFKEQHDAVIQSATTKRTSGFWNAAVKESKPFLIELKELTLLGFFTSEPGATQVLQYNQTPGPYQGCVPLATVGKAWAT